MLPEHAAEGGGQTVAVRHQGLELPGRLLLYGRGVGLLLHGAVGLDEHRFQLGAPGLQVPEILAVRRERRQQELKVSQHSRECRFSSGHGLLLEPSFGGSKIRRLHDAET